MSRGRAGGASTTRRRVLTCVVALMGACALNRAQPVRYSVLEAQDVVVAPGVTVTALLGVSRLVEPPPRSSCGRMALNGCRWEPNWSPANGYGAFVALAQAPGSRAVSNGPGGAVNLANDLPTRTAAEALVRPARVVGCVDPNGARTALRIDREAEAGDRWIIFKLRGRHSMTTVARGEGWACAGRDDGTARGAQAECACVFAHESAWRRAP